MDCLSLGLCGIYCRRLFVKNNYLVGIFWNWCTKNEHGLVSYSTEYRWSLGKCHFTRWWNGAVIYNDASQLLDTNSIWHRAWQKQNPARVYQFNLYVILYIFCAMWNKWCALDCVVYSLHFTQTHTHTLTHTYFHIFIVDFTSSKMFAKLSHICGLAVNKKIWKALQNIKYTVLLFLNYFRLSPGILYTAQFSFRPK